MSALPDFGMFMKKQGMQCFSWCNLVPVSISTYPAHCEINFIIQLKEDGRTEQFMSTFAVLQTVYNIKRLLLNPPYTVYGRVSSVVEGGSEELYRVLAGRICAGNVEPPAMPLEEYLTLVRCIARGGCINTEICRDWFHTA